MSAPTFEDRERALHELSDAYIRSKISLDDFDKLLTRYGTGHQDILDYNALATELRARERASSDFTVLAFLGAMGASLVTAAALFFLLASLLNGGLPSIDLALPFLLVAAFVVAVGTLAALLAYAVQRARRQAYAQKLLSYTRTFWDSRPHVASKLKENAEAPRDKEGQ